MRNNDYLCTNYSLRGGSCKIATLMLCNTDTMGVKRKIAWITADYFIDVDIPIVPALRAEYDIEWYVIEGHDGKINLSAMHSDESIHFCKMPYRRRDPRCVLFYAQIAQQIQRFAPDIIYIDAIEMPYMYPVFDFYLSCRKMVHAAHNVVSYPGWPNRRMMQAYLEYVFVQHRNFHIFSQHTRAVFEQKYQGRNILCTPLSLKDFGKPSPAVHLDREKVRLLFFGNVKQNKRLDVLLEAYARLPLEVRERSHLSVLGLCENEQPYIGRIKELGNSVTFNPRRIPDEEVADIFASHHYLMLPYENVAQSGPHMIAYNYGVPVIATDIEGFTEHITDGSDGYLFPVNNIDKLSQVLIRVITQPQDDYDVMRNNLLKRVADKYATEAILQEYKRYFETI